MAKWYHRLIIAGGGEACLALIMLRFVCGSNVETLTANGGGWLRWRDKNFEKFVVVLVLKNVSLSTKPK